MSFWWIFHGGCPDSLVVEGGALTASVLSLTTAKGHQVQIQFMASEKVSSDLGLDERFF